MMQAAISADIVSSSSLFAEEKGTLNSRIRHFLNEMEGEKSQGSWGRIVKGDAVEIFLSNPHSALRTALQLKALVKSMPVDQHLASAPEKNGKRGLFQKYGVRLAIGLGEMAVADKANDIMDGEAIYYAGRLMEYQGTSQKERAVVKNTLFFKAKSETLTRLVNVILGLTDVLFRKANARQCEVLYHKLSGKTELEIAEILNIRQSAVNQHSTAVGWNAIEQSILYFENLNFEDYA